jgi:hypothetical protein
MQELGPETFEVKPRSPWRLNVQEIEWRCRNAVISSLYGGLPCVPEPCHVTG